MASSTGTPVLASLCSKAAGQYRHGGDQLGIGIHHNRRLVSVKAFAAALVAVAHHPPSTNRNTR